MKHYYVIIDSADPGSEHDTYEEAREVCVELQMKGYPDTRIVGGPDDLGFREDGWLADV